MYLMSDAQYVTREAMTLLSNFVEKRLTPYVRQKFACSGCSLCTALIRRFQDKDRTVHPYHYDGQAFVTCVVALNPQDYEGGLYVQGIESVHERRFVNWTAGDMVCHQFDLGHGVHVLNGFRYSLIFWFKNAADKCASESVSHNNIPAQEGHAAAQFNLARMFEHGEGVEENWDAALQWYLKAAEQGHDLAEVRVGTAYLFGSGVERNATIALSWLNRAGTKGNPTAQIVIGGLHQRKNLTAAREWYHKAAIQDKADAQFLYGNVLEKNDAEDPMLAHAWWRRAARGGSVGAQLRLGDLHWKGVEAIYKDFGTAEMWYQKAMAAGSNDAKLALSEMYASRTREGDMENIKFLEKAEI
eukprot:gnl/MRDRNA2_/MRDRNA2_74010_c0_seq1.p1 gnl/MRDRNA2_/MRDRNA2_74010_c0~~gnl/MRDRNA2_/MRDRNA2_74010_c0_seq1.p1  ORF type:complete len:391 (+),score=72.79 gnl/MRDRNA2_/MRDRNA2_74010_c0_seq1:104-1174(+)